MLPESSILAQAAVVKQRLHPTLLLLLLLLLQQLQQWTARTCARAGVFKSKCDQYGILSSAFNAAFLLAKP
jgi:hypothetical protein